MPCTEEQLLEPIKAYNTVLKQEINQAANDTFNELALKSETDVDANRLTIEKLNNAKDEKSKLAKKNVGKKSLKAILITLSTIFFIVGGVTLYTGVSGMIELNISIAIAAVAVALAIACIILVANVLNKSIKNLNNRIDELEQEIANLINEATEQMRRLNASFDWNISNEIITKAVPLVTLDRYFDGNKETYLKEQYGLGNDPEDLSNSSLCVQSGSILGNPFLIRKAKICSIYDKEYTGSLTITWSTFTRDAKGNMKRVTHTQTLHASSYHPAPRFIRSTSLIYGNQAAPDLTFSRSPNPNSSKAKKDMDKYIKKEYSDMKSLAEKSLSKGGTLTPLSNDKFETLFHAWDRDNEQQFRLLFTPLAQRNMENVLLSKDGYGDDFYFNKKKKVNSISSLHSQTFDYSGDPKNFVGIEYDKVKENFVNYINEYFRHFYFDLVPLLSIPLYQQMKTIDYIYGDDAPSNFATYEHEVMVNAMNERNFLDPKSDTEGILKTRLVKKDGDIDSISVTGYSYRGESRMDYVSKLGGDGNYHMVPVPWVEYFELQKTTDVEVLKTESTQDEYNQDIKESLQEYGSGNVTFQRSIMAYLGEHTKDIREKMGQYFSKRKADDKKEN